MLNFLKTYEINLICSIYGYEYGTFLPEISLFNFTDKNKKKGRNFANTINCKENMTDILNCQLIELK